MLGGWVYRQIVGAHSRQEIATEVYQQTAVVAVVQLSPHCHGRRDDVACCWRLTTDRQREKQAQNRITMLARQNNERKGRKRERKLIPYNFCGFRYGTGHHTIPKQ
eukprot:scaffold10650_cov169-Amphora_coffeaeformis.AAC.5